MTSPTPKNFRQHADRLRQCAQILADHGQKLGLEYVAPRTLLRSQRHPFVHTMSEMKELMVAIGTNNLGIQLDSWHWFHAEETDKELLTLRGDCASMIRYGSQPPSPDAKDPVGFRDYLFRVGIHISCNSRWRPRSSAVSSGGDAVFGGGNRRRLRATCRCRLPKS